MPLSRAIRRWLIAVAIAAGLVVSAAVALFFLVDVNSYRPLIAAKVREATGRTITLGKVSFALLPTPGLSVGRALCDCDPKKVLVRCGAEARERLEGIEGAGAGTWTGSALAGEAGSRR